MKTLASRSLVLTLSLISSSIAVAVPISDDIVASSPFHFRDTRTPTRSGFFIGDRLAVGVESVTPNPENGVGGDLTQVVARQGSFEFDLVFIGGVFGGQYVNSTAFDPGLTGAWDVVISNPGSTNSPQILTTPTVGTASLVPFVTDGVMTPSGITPRISWQLPSSFTPDQVRIFVLDLDRQSADGAALVIHRENLPANATSFTFPTLLENGQSLDVGGRYEIAVQLQKFRAPNSLLARSRTFFSFSPLSAGPEVALPIVGPDRIFTFDHGVTSAQPLALEAEVASGYDYRIGDSDPLFESVRILSDLGDGVYDLTFNVGSVSMLQSLSVGELFSFSAFGGVDAFSIMGIEPDLGLDPLNPSAFLSLVTFVDDGRFTGTMTPRPLATPSTLPTLAVTLLLVAGSRLRSRRAAVRSLR